MTAGQDPQASPGDDPQGTPVEILARFARSASRDAPQGTLIVDGREPLRFAGWLDLMAIVEGLLDDERAATRAAAQHALAEQAPDDVP